MNCSECGICIDHPADTGGVCELPKSHLPPCSTCEQRGVDAMKELGRKCSSAMQERLFDQMLNGEGCGIAAYTNVPRGPSPMASALPLLEAIKRMEEQSIGSVPFRPAYLFMPPELFSHIPMTTFVDDSDANYASSRMDFRVFQDYGVRVQPYSPILYGDCGASEARVDPVVWKDVEQSAKPSALIWSVVVAFLCWLLCAASGLL